MKQKLLLLILPVLFFTVTTQAQKTWNFSEETIWPISAGIPAAGGPVVVDQLTIVPHSSSDNMAQIENSSVDFGDGFTSARRFKTNGSGGASGAMPTVRYIKFTVSGNCDVKIWYAAGGTSERTLFISDGTNVLNSFVANANPVVPGTITASFTGGASSDIYVYGSNNFSLYKIEVTGATVLSNKKFNSLISANINAVGSRIYVSNVKTATDISIYSITGALVKTFKTNSDTDFSLKSGLYVATIKTVEGQKSVKLLLN